MKLLVFILALVACSPPPLSLRFRLTDGDSQKCIGDDDTVTTKCEDITLGCDAVLSVRIVPPNDSTLAYVSVCKKMQDAQDTLCGIAGIDLPAPTTPIPEQILEVQMAVFPESVVPRDPVTGNYICPPVDFGATGLPLTALPGCSDEDPGTCPRVPAVGGRAYYYPGDEKTVVTLGCSDLDHQLKAAACTGEHSVPVTGLVADFDSSSFVDQAIANRLTVSFGEPTPLGAEYALFPQDAIDLVRTGVTFPPSWSGVIDAAPVDTQCLVVLEDGAQTTSTLTCAAAPSFDAPMIDLTGFRLAKSTLSQILAAIGQSTFPDAGLTIGLVLDNTNIPAAGITVTAMPPSGAPPTIQYLSANRMSVGGTQTSASGIFISQLAPFGTKFSVPNQNALPVIGGMVLGKVTIVVMRQGAPTPGG